MHNSTYRSFLFVGFLCAGYCSFAQTDSSDAYLDLGQFQVRKDFTQSVVIKGSDLEKMPFSTLTEAIHSWLYGMYSQKQSLAYVVDGNLQNDVDAYSIYDIEEIRLVQNSLSTLSGGYDQRQLVLITTRKGGPHKKGLRLAAQTTLTRREKGAPTSQASSSETSFFHQYDAAAYYNGNKLQYSLSLNYLREAQPTIPYPLLTKEKPEHVNLWRINGYLTARLNAHHDLTVRFNSSPQSYRNQYSYTLPEAVVVRVHSYDTKKTHLPFNPSLQLRSRFLKRFSNNLSVSYLNNTYKEATFYQEEEQVVDKRSSQDHQNNKSQWVLVREQLQYNLQAGAWSIEPSMNVSLSYYKSNEKAYGTRYLNNNVIGVYGTTFLTENTTWLLTPSLLIGYKNIFSVQAGAQIDVSKDRYGQLTRHAPFATAGVNVLNAQQAKGHSLQLFGSVTTASFMGQPSHNLATIPSLEYDPTVYWPAFSSYFYRHNNDSYNWSGGLEWGLANKRFTVQYYFERRHFQGLVYGIDNSSNLSYPPFRSSAHYVTLQGRLIDKASISWTTRITGARIRNTSDSAINGYDAHYTIGQLNTADAAWTGGWVNRFAWKQLSAGVDLSYYFTSNSTINRVSGRKVHSLGLQHVFVGYRVPLRNQRSLEVYATGRNIAQHNRLLPGGERKYFGLGIKADL